MMVHESDRWIWVFLKDLGTNLGTRNVKLVDDLGVPVAIEKRPDM